MKIEEARIYKQVMEEAHTFTDKHFKELCIELCEWEDTGILCNGKVRELANILSKINTGSHIQFAKSMIERYAVRLNAQ